MSVNLDALLEELYLVDPALRDEEEALKRTIKELLASRPEHRMDEAFEAELKARLLAEFSKKARSKKRPALLARPAYRVGLGLAAAAAALVAVYVGFGPGRGMPGPGGPATGDGAAYQAPIAATSQAANKAPAQAQAKLKDALPPVSASAGKAEGQAGGAAIKASAVDEKRDDALLGLASEEAPQLARQLAPSSAATGGPAASGEAERRAASETLVPSAPPPAPSATTAQAKAAPANAQAPAAAAAPLDKAQDFDREGYDRIVETSFAKVLEEPLSTFSIDVDTASYANVRRFLREGSLPPPDAVRIEELVNYFPYDYAGPGEAAGSAADEPFAFDAELSACPWNAAHSLLRVALQAKRIAEKDIPPSNLVFLIDTSGSMEDENKLPLVKESLKLLARRLRQEDRVSIAVYAGSAGLVLGPTAGNRTDVILKAIDGLESGGSTAGGEGIKLAYETAKKSFIEKGSNRVILATDGDFNVGPSSDGELVRLIEEQRKAGVFLTVLGFGMGNYQDSKMQKLADSGNGNYAYVDSLAEADKVLAKQMAGTLFTVAKDVKVQIEFNPARVGEYRLIGYEKRALAARDFADDTKDAGELGAGSSVTALYELTPPSGAKARTDLKYQSATVTGAASAAELMTLKFRYKRPDGSASSLVERPVEIAQREISGTSADFRFAAAVAEWGLVLRASAYKGDASLGQAASLAKGALGRDPGGYRAEFLQLVALSERLGAR
jgi:Ca-activated chloride channel homolog